MATMTTIGPVAIKYTDVVGVETALRLLAISRPYNSVALLAIADAVKAAHDKAEADFKARVNRLCADDDEPVFYGQ